MIGRLFAGLLGAALLAGCNGPASKACAIDGARYVLRDHAYTASFREVSGALSAHRLIIDVHSAKAGRTYSFTINRGNGVGDATLSPVNGMMNATVPLYTVNDAGKFVDYFGDRTGPAPRRLLLPTLGQALWYDISELTNGATDQREPMPLAFFDRVACGPVRP
ncbi:MAG: hypothetical protein GC145_05165 [Caulobacter sp.]|nr:hypothetical protein [Caulobacter sp.]